jgi:dihydrofolate reductase
LDRPRPRRRPPPVRRHHLQRHRRLLAAASRQPDAPPHDRYVARRYAEGIPITVVSDSITRWDIRVWSEQTTIVRRADAHDAVTRLREQDDERDVLIFGSRTLWTDLLAHGLIDELDMMIGPKVVAGDHRAFTGGTETALRLLDVRSWKDSGSVVLRYAVGEATT